MAFLGIFGWGLFASTLVPALAIGLNWPGATRPGAIASIATGLVEHARLRVAGLLPGLLTSRPASPSPGLSLVLSLLVFFVVSLATRRQANEVDPDIRLVMDT